MMKIRGLKGVAMAMATASLIAGAGDAADAPRKTPYFASIGAKTARMRTGPQRTYPASWLYIRADLPVKVVQVMKEWRKVEDPSGTQGWMLGVLISDTRTAMVQGGITELRDAPNPGARVAWRAEPGVIGRVSQCRAGWCRLDVRGQAGFVETARLWGVAPDEMLP